MEIHFINVGCGNMTLMLFPDGTIWLYDCNVTDANETSALRYLSGAMGTRKNITAFICSHRDADHMRGIKKIHKKFPIGGIWDNGLEGTTTGSSEYREYMDLRGQLRNGTIAVSTQTIGHAAVTWIHSGGTGFTEPNDQSIVLKVAFRGSSVLLAGDTSYRPWKERLVRAYGDVLNADILLASHHGSISFFDDPNDTKNYYTDHIRKINPAMTIISTGPNVHGLPDKAAVDLYAKYSRGSNNGTKVVTTQEKGNIKLTLKDDGSWSLSYQQ